MLNVDFSVRKGEFLLQPRFYARDELVVLIGPSGSGKSLTLKAVAGLLTPESGRIVLPDGSVAFDSAAKINVPPQRRNLGYLVQDLALFPHLSVRENIGFALHGTPRQAATRRVDELLELLQLEEAADRRPNAISGGQQQRTALARALAHEPRLLLLDEPFSALDRELRSTLRRELVALRRRLRVTALFVTHDISEAYAIADRLIVYDRGSVIQTGTRDEVFYRPASINVARLVGVKNFISASIIDVRCGRARVQTPWFETTVAAGDATIGDTAFVCIRPEHVIIPRSTDRLAESNGVVLTARIVHDTAHPVAHSLTMSVEEPAGREPLVLEVDVPSHPYALLDLGPGATRDILLPAESLFLTKESPA